MFHHSTTLHHRRNEFSMPGRERRVVHLGWFATKKLQMAVFANYMRGPTRVFKTYLKPITWPIGKAFDLTIKGMNAAADGLEWSTYAAIEAGKGALQTTVAPFGMLAYSRLVALKRTLWDVGIDSLKALVKTPLALASSPVEFARGVRDAVTGTLNSGKEFMKSLFQGKLRDTITHTRNAVGSLMAPITRPTKSIFSPLIQVVKTAVGAQLATVSAARQAVTETMPGGIRRIGNAPATASAILAEKKAHRAALKALLNKEEEEREQAWKEQVASEMGVAGGGAKKAA